MTMPDQSGPFKPLQWIRRSPRIWECKLFAEYSLTIMAQQQGYLFRRRYYPCLAEAKQAAAALYLAELTPLLAEPQPQMQQAA